MQLGYEVNGGSRGCSQTASFYCKLHARFVCGDGAVVKHCTGGVNTLGDDKQAEKGFQLARRKLEMMQRDIQEYDLIDLCTGITRETDTFFDLLETGEAKLDEARQNLRYEEFYDLTQESFNLLQAIKHNQTYQNYCMFVVEERKENLEKLIEIRVNEELSKRLASATAVIKENFEKVAEKERKKYVNSIQNLKDEKEKLDIKLKEANKKLQKLREIEEKELEERKIAQKEAKQNKHIAIPTWALKQLMAKSNLSNDYDRMRLGIDFTTKEGKSLYNNIYNLKDSRQPRLPALKEVGFDKIRDAEQKNKWDFIYRKYKECYDEYDETYYNSTEVTEETDYLAIFINKCFPIKCERFCISSVNTSDSYLKIKKPERIKCLINHLSGVEDTFMISKCTVKSDEFCNIVKAGKHLNTLVFDNGKILSDNWLDFDCNLEYKIQTLSFQGGGGSKRSNWESNIGGFIAILRAIKDSTLRNSIINLNLNGCDISMEIALASLKESNLKNIKLQIKNRIGFE